MATQFQKAVKAAVEASDIYPDKVVAKKDGTVEVKKSFYYRFNRSSGDWASQVSAVAKAAGVEHQSIGREDYADWPKTSYFVAIVRPA